MARRNTPLRICALYAACRTLYVACGDGQALSARARLSESARLELCRLAGLRLRAHELRVEAGDEHGAHDLRQVRVAVEHGAARRLRAVERPACGGNKGTAGTHKRMRVLANTNRMLKVTVRQGPMNENEHGAARWLMRRIHACPCTDTGPRKARLRPCAAAVAPRPLPTRYRYRARGTEYPE